MGELENLMQETAQHADDAEDPVTQLLVQRPLLSLMMIARDAGCSWYTVWSAISRNELHGVQVAGRWLVAEADGIRWIGERARKARLKADRAAKRHRVRR